MDLASAITRFLSGDELVFSPTSESEQVIIQYIHALKAHIDGNSHLFLSYLSDFKLNPKAKWAAQLLEVRMIYLEFGWSRGLEQIKSLGHFQILSEDDLYESFWKIDYLMLCGSIELNLSNYHVAADNLLQAKKLAQKFSLFERSAISLHNYCVCMEEIQDNYRLDQALRELEKMCHQNNLRSVFPLYYNFRAMEEFQHASFSAAHQSIKQGCSYLQNNPGHIDHITLKFFDASIYLREGNFKLFNKTLIEISKISRVRERGLFKDSNPILKASYLVKIMKFSEALKLINSINVKELYVGDQIKIIHLKIQCSIAQDKNIIDKQEIDKILQYILNSSEREDSFEIDLIYFKAKWENPLPFRKPLQKLRNKMANLNMPYNLLKIEIIELYYLFLSHNWEEIRNSLLSLVEQTCEKGLKYDELNFLTVLQYVLKTHFNQKLDKYQEKRILLLKRQFTAREQSSILQIWPYKLFGQQKIEHFIFDWNRSLLVKDFIHDTALPSTGLPIKLIKLLDQHRGNTVSYDNITKEIWREKYNPTTHDSKIYNLLSKARKLIKDRGGKSTWILSISAAGYQLIDNKKREVAHINSKNERLELFLQQFSTDGTIKSQMLSKEFSQSERQSQRDLRSLCQRGFLEAYGEKKNRYYKRVAKKKKVSSA